MKQYLQLNAGAGKSGVEAFLLSKGIENRELLPRAKILPHFPLFNADGLLC
jgi:hypothetical protein